MNAADIINLAGSYQFISTIFVLPPATITQLLKANPRRWCAIFSAPGGANNFIWTDNTISGTRGIALSTNVPVFQTSIKDHASLTQSEWFGFSAGGANFSVIEVVIP